MTPFCAVATVLDRSRNDFLEAVGEPGRCEKDGALADLGPLRSVSGILFVTRSSYEKK